MHVFILILISVSSIVGKPNVGIYGGHDAQRGQYPYMVTLQVCNKISNACITNCGGAILSPTWIVTAAQCINSHPELVYDKIIIGALKLSEDSPDQQIVNLTRIIPHPDYDVTNTLNTQLNDISLWELTEPIKYTDVIQPVLLPEPFEEFIENATVTGWGQMRSGFFADTLQALEAPFVTYQECYDVFEPKIGADNLNNILSQNLSLCAGDIRTTDGICYGDAGNPIVQDGKIFGVVTWCMIPCGQVGYPAVYTKISAYVDWINKYVNDEY